MLLGRAPERARLRELLQPVTSGRSCVAVICGEPGIGKTSLLQDAASIVPDALVLRTTGVEGESDIPYAHLADALRPLFSEIPTLPDRQAAALSAAFAIGPAMPADRFVISVAVLNLLSGQATHRPVLLLVDDLQWVDRGSREVLTFVSHRIEADCIGVLLAVRDTFVGGLGLERFDRIALVGLDTTSCRLLIERTRGPQPPAEIEALIRGSGGNPLALLELPGPTSRLRSLGWGQLSEPRPLTIVLEQVFVASSRRLSEKCQAGLALLSVIGQTSEDTLTRALDGVGLKLDVLDEAEQSGLVQSNHGRYAFVHPLVRSAVYQGIPSRDRRLCHQLAAGALAGATATGAAERRAWHLLESGVSTNVALAEELDTNGERHLRSANFAAAALAFQRSAMLSPAGPQNVRRLLMAAQSARLSGEVDDCRSLLAEALRSDQDGAYSFHLEYLLCRLDLWAGDKLGSRDRLLALATGGTGIASSGAEAMPALSAYMAADVSLASVELGDLALADDWSTRAMVAGASRGVVPLTVVAVRALVSGLRGDRDATAELNRRREEVAVVNPVSADLDEQVLLLVGLAHLAGEDVDQGRAVLQRSVDAARANSALGMLPFRLGRLALAELWTGGWARAAAHANEALRLAADTGWEGERLHSLVVCARVEAGTGLDERCRRHVDEAEELAAAQGAWSYLAGARCAEGQAALARRDFEKGLESLEQVELFAAEREIVDTPLLWWTGDLIDCLVAADRVDEAAAVFDRHDRLGLADRPILAAVHARCRALVDPVRADEHLDEAMRWHRRSSAPFERARTEYVLGQRRRRARDPAARDILASALTTFERLGAIVWAGRVRDELRASGVRVARPDVTLADLTPQELQVAVAVGQGHSNREVAAQLFLSVKTVEYHLNKAFQKLGVARRGQLAALLAQQAAEGAPPRGRH